MRDIRWQKVWRDFWYHRRRSLATVAAMSVGLFGAGFVLNTWSLLRTTTALQYAGTNPPHATLQLVKPAGVTWQSICTAARGAPEVALVHARQSAVVRASAGGTVRTAVVFTAPDLHAQPIGRLAHEQGAWPVGRDSAVVDQSSVAFAGLALGDSMHFAATDGRTLALPVTGIVRDAGLAPGWMDHLVYVFLAESTFSTLRTTAVSELRFTVAQQHPARGTVRRVSRDVVQRLGAIGVQVVHVEVPEPGEHMHAGQMDSLLMIQGAFGALALVLSALLITNLMAATLAAQRPQIAVMKAVGARPAQLVCMYAVLAAALGLASAAISLPLAAVIGRAYADFAGELLNFSVGRTPIPWYAIAIQLATAILLPLLASAAPVWRACRVPVAEALRPQIGHLQVPSFRRIPAPLREHRVVMFATRNLWRHQRRVGFTILTLATGGALFLGALQLRRSIQDSVANVFEQTLRYGAVVRLEHPTAAARVTAALEDHPGIERIESWATARAAIVSGGRIENSFGIIAPLPGSPLLAPALSGGRWLRNAVDDTNSIVVTRELAAAEPGLGLDSVAVLAISGLQRPWRVVGVVPILGRTAYALPSALERLTGGRDATMIVLGLPPADTAVQRGTLEQVQARLESMGMPVAGVQLLAATRAASEDHVLMVVDFLIVIAQLTILVAGLGLASTLGLAVLERTREIGVLRAVGATPAAIMALVQGEGLAIAAVSALAAIPLSLPISVLLGQAFGRVMFPVPVRLVPLWSSVALWMAVALGLAILASAGPAWRATRISAREALSAA